MTLGPPTDQPKAVAERYYDYRTTFPFLERLKENYETVLSEYLALEEKDWVDWPEKEIYTEKDQWKVFPFRGLGKWFDRNGSRCPKTYEILKSLPGIGASTFSRMGPSTVIKPHHGWADVADAYLRCHFGLVIPVDLSGVWVEGEVRFHKAGDIIVFDDSKAHTGFNRSDGLRAILILDIERPLWVPRGNSPQQVTGDLMDLVDAFS